MTEPTYEGPGEPTDVEHPAPPEEYESDGEEVVSDETGTRYDALGEPESTPEDETTWNADTEG